MIYQILLSIWFDVVLVCDATNAVTDTECNYIKTMGTTYTESYSNSMSVDVTVKNEMSAKFFDIFSEKIGISVSTGYDWSYASSETVRFGIICLRLWRGSAQWLQIAKTRHKICSLDMISQIFPSMFQRIHIISFSGH